MTIEEKAKRYDKTLEQLKGLIEVTREDKCDIAKEDIIDIFPELKESEDEKIRKGIIRNLEYLMNRAEGFVKGELKERIAWLEKQGEPTDINPSEFDLRLNKLLKQFETLSKEELASSLSFYLNVVQNDGTYKAEEKQGEQKPIDKVEPKFKNGQWIVWRDKCYKVNYNGCGYELVDQDGLSTSLEYGTIDENAHLWNIQDAKDGDVLVCNDNPFLFLKYEKDEYGLVCCSYCGISDSEYGEFAVNTNTKKYWCDIEFVNPATKEQRDLLFQKMKEAGYEWDADKKEPKKIEQEPTELAKGEDYGIDGLWHAQRILEKTFGKVDGYQTDDGILSHECAISAVKELYEQKPAWSEEDEDYYDAIIAKLEVTKDDALLTDNQMEFLKSLKDRVQVKQEWSKEDEKMVESLHGWLDTLVNYIHHDAIVSLDLRRERMQQVEQLKTWLKSLRPQNHWKPTEAQLASLTIACDRNDRIGFDLTELLKDLKKL